ncbi:MAG: transposase [Acidobacteria bacterium]|nr:transposase [Acidobacteriota bacterium]
MQFSHLLQADLFPTIEAALGPLSSQARRLSSVLAMISLSRFLPDMRGGKGRPREDRQALARAFLAKAVYGLAHTRQLLDRLAADAQLRRLCGWQSSAQVPHESTFSRAFAAFAASELPQRIHETLVRESQRDRLIGHIARDATAIPARERFPTPPKKKKRRKYQRRPKRARAAERGSRIERQRQMSLSAMLAELPRHCDIGGKKNSKGHAAYDARAIHEHSQSLGHVPIISPVQRHSAPKSVTTQPKLPRQLSWAEQDPMRERSMSERVNARLKDESDGKPQGTASLPCVPGPAPRDAATS